MEAKILPDFQICISVPLMNSSYGDGPSEAATRGVL